MAGKARKRFSTVVSKVVFDGHTLEVTGRFRLAALALIGMTGVTGWGALHGGPLPVPVRLMMGLGLVICLYGVLDTLFGKAHLRFNKASQTLEVLRTSPFASARYLGPIGGPAKVQVGRVAAGRGTRQVQLYQVVLLVTLPDAFVRFPLEVTSMRGDVADAQVAAWEHKLGLDGTDQPSGPVVPEAAAAPVTASPPNKA